MPTSAPRPILIVKTGDTLDTLRPNIGDFEHWIETGLTAGAGEGSGDKADPANAHKPPPIQVLDARHASPLPGPETLAGVVITGSHAMVSDREAWSEALVPWLARLVAQGTPVLGICYGHQLLAHALGGEVGYHPGGLELGTVPITLTPEAQADPLFAHLPAQLTAQVVHAQSVRALPPGAVRLAGNAHEPHQAYRIGAHAWGVQFHPEFSLAAMQGYVQHLAATLPAGHTPPMVQETPQACSLLGRFAQLCGSAPRPH